LSSGSARAAKGGAKSAKATRVPKSRQEGRQEAPPDSLALSATRMLNIGYGNLIHASRVVAVVSPQSSPMRRLRVLAEERGKLIDATEGRRTRSIIVTDSDHIILSAINPETIAARLSADDIDWGGR
jgi:regulator of extracellular matrix RemA (YlzA/DUF370 family)